MRGAVRSRAGRVRKPCRPLRDRKSTRLNSSHLVISYAVFCLKKKTKDCTLYLILRVRHGIYIETAIGKTITLDVVRSETIEIIKANLQDKERFSLDN